MTLSWSPNRAQFYVRLKRFNNQRDYFLNYAPLAIYLETMPSSSVAYHPAFLPATPFNCF